MEEDDLDLMGMKLIHQRKYATLIASTKQDAQTAEDAQKRDDAFAGDLSFYTPTIENDLVLSKYVLNTSKS